jgi:hypothetical protein
MGAPVVVHEEKGGQRERETPLRRKNIIIDFDVLPPQFSWGVVWGRHSLRNRFRPVEAPAASTNSTCPGSPGNRGGSPGDRGVPGDPHQAAGAERLWDPETLLTTKQHPMLFSS